MILKYKSFVSVLYPHCFCLCLYFSYGSLGTESGNTAERKMLMVSLSAAEETQPTDKSASLSYLLCLNPPVHCCNNPTSVVTQPFAQILCPRNQGKVG